MGKAKERREKWLDRKSRFESGYIMYDSNLGTYRKCQQCGDKKCIECKCEDCGEWICKGFNNKYCDC